MWAESKKKRSAPVVIAVQYSSFKYLNMASLIYIHFAIHLDTIICLDT